VADMKRAPGIGGELCLKLKYPLRLIETTLNHGHTLIDRRLSPNSCDMSLQNTQTDAGKPAAPSSCMIVNGHAVNSTKTLMLSRACHRVFATSP